MFNVGELVILNQNIEKGLPGHSGEVVEIVRKIKSPNYDYEVDLGNSINPVKENELAELTDYEKELIKYIYKGNKVNFTRTDETVTISKVDFIHGQVEIKFEDGGHLVTEFASIIPLDKEIDSLGEFKFKIGDTVKAITNDASNGKIGAIVNYFNDSYGISYDVLFGESHPCAFGEHELELHKVDKDIVSVEEINNSVHEDLLHIFFGHYKNSDNTYTVPEQLLINILEQLYIEGK